MLGRRGLPSQSAKSRYNSASVQQAYAIAIRPTIFWAGTAGIRRWQVRGNRRGGTVHARGSRSSLPRPFLRLLWAKPGRRSSQPRPRCCTCRFGDSSRIDRVTLVWNTRWGLWFIILASRPCRCHGIKTLSNNCWCLDRSASRFIHPGAPRYSTLPL